MFANHIEDLCLENVQAQDLATLLLHAAPASARRFALAMHEKACEAGEEDWCGLWRDVVEILSQEQAAMAA